MGGRREAVGIVEHIADAQRAAVAAKVETWWREFFARGFHALPAPTDCVGTSMLERYRAALLWCPLLKDGLCSAYASRPSSWAHAAVGSPARCQDDKKRLKQKFLSTVDHAGGGSLRAQPFDGRRSAAAPPVRPPRRVARASLARKNRT